MFPWMLGSLASHANWFSRQELLTSPSTLESALAMVWEYPAPFEATKKDGHPVNHDPTLGKNEKQSQLEFIHTWHLHGYTKTYQRKSIIV
ncbi:hypothetical protein MJO28_013029 [Puccinia striiformis f. sp. tritici]|uniref:Uncharacterized protein n=1 Tax=Puccinia striiformis f. sp. tritici TaxID=168172 RepID=A0ACC0DX28_9BASI|nr:hypothetical protein Pst134EB_025170 [Puccinia striiformis f. sp. tritici]KAI7940744.1 hypothetical protein MJO28_013029 [Puccinia striiformis f. sp. tritici]